MKKVFIGTEAIIDFPHCYQLLLVILHDLTAKSPSSSLIKNK
jgi:hypothetical protein